MPYTDLLKGRYSESQRIYFITSVISQRTTVFTDFYCARKLVQVIRNSDRDNNTLTLAWVVMPDHFHWLFQLKQDTELSKQ